MKLQKSIVSAFVLVALMVSSAHAVQKMKKIQGPTSYSIGSPLGVGTTTGTLVATSGCSKVILGVYTKHNNGSLQVIPYAEVASTSTGTAYRTASLGSFAGTSDWYWRTMTAPESPYMRPVFSYTSGLTATTEMWCVYENGAQ